VANLAKSKVFTPSFVFLKVLYRQATFVKSLSLVGELLWISEVTFPSNSSHAVNLIPTRHSVYTLDAIRYITSSNPTSIVTATATPHLRDANSDRKMTVTYQFPFSITADSLVDIQEPGWGPFGIIPHWIKNSITIKLERGEIYHYGLTLPHIYHNIKVRPIQGKERVENAYSAKNGLGETWWSSYGLFCY
jgi:hypothetical protein